MKFNMKTLRFLISGAAPLSGPLVKAVRSKLSSVGAEVLVTQGKLYGHGISAVQIKTLRKGYGLTETSPTSHLLSLVDSERKVGSVGQLLPNLEARLVLDDGKDAKEGDAGELWIRGPTIMKVCLGWVYPYMNSR